MKVLIGNAWTFANGSLHIGHLSSNLPGDVIARYYRSKGDEVYFVSGTDCHGTPIELRAKQEAKTPQEISDYYHNEYVACFEQLGFTFDHYGKTSSSEHADFVKQFHKEMYEGEYIYEKEELAAFCEHCNIALADRFITGKCPSCGSRARGDQCDSCGSIIDAESLTEAECAICGSAPVFRPANHLFLAISKFRCGLEAFVGARPTWRKNAIGLTRRYIDEGLRDRAITRDLEWGIDVPKEGYEGKKIYVWAENVLGYLSMANSLSLARGEDPTELWAQGTMHYYVHGKDNIPFHTIVLPSLMLAHGGEWKLPDNIISSEFLTLEGRKISTSENWAIFAKDLLATRQPDSIRYFLIANAPERRDADFTWREFVNSNNSELLGSYGNFINRTLAFIYKYMGGVVPCGTVDPQIETRMDRLFTSVGKQIENGDIKDALFEIFEFVRFANKYYDAHRPWETASSDLSHCAQTIFNCVQIAANLAVLLKPFIPFSSEKIVKWLGIDDSWSLKSIPALLPIPEPELLFERLDKKTVEEELVKLGI
ncbi:MAG: methionine--tRNA ligase [Eubacteriaceae bacterium]|nr:methionine--tRNA ligase [Eubacteriaceae bacterium]